MGLDLNCGPGECLLLFSSKSSRLQSKTLLVMLLIYKSIIGLLYQPFDKVGIVLERRGFKRPVSRNTDIAFRFGNLYQLT